MGNLEKVRKKTYRLQKWPIWEQPLPPFCSGETSEEAVSLEEAPIFHQGQIPETDEQLPASNDQVFC